MKRCILSAYLLLCSITAFSQDLPLEVRIDVSHDTVYQKLDSAWMRLYYPISDSIVKIIFENKGAEDIVIEDRFILSYENDLPMSTMYFNCWYADGDSFVKYNYGWADIDFMEPPDGFPKDTLKPGQKIIIYKNPFMIYGYNSKEQLHRVQLVFYGEVNGKYKTFKSNYAELYFDGAKDTLAKWDDYLLHMVAENAYKKGEYYRAALLYNELLSRGSNNKIEQWRYERGMCALMAGNYTNASVYLEGIIGIKGDEVDRKLKFAKVLILDKQFDRAAYEYRKILNRLDELDSLQKVLPGLIMDANQMQAEVDARDPFKLRRKAWDFKYHENYDSALYYYNKAIQYDKKGFSDYLQRGFCKYKLGKYDGALEDVNRYLIRSPDWSWAYYYRGLIYIAKKEYGKACKDIDTAVEFDGSGYFMEEHRSEVAELRSKYCY